MDELRLILLQKFLPMIMREMLIRFGYWTDITTENDDFNNFLKGLDAFVKKLLPKKTNPLDYIDDVDSLFLDLSDSGLVSYIDDVISFSSLPSLSLRTHTLTSSEESKIQLPVLPQEQEIWVPPTIIQVNLGTSSSDEPVEEEEVLVMREEPPEEGFVVIQEERK